MLNLLRGDALHNNTELYDRVLSQWQKVVLGGLTLLVTVPLEVGSISVGSLGPAIFGGALALGGAGLSGFGLGQLQETSRALERSLAKE
jgi:hypothetical protein